MCCDDVMCSLMWYTRVSMLFMQNGDTALTYASGLGQASTVRVLLQHGAVVDHKKNVRIIVMTFVHSTITSMHINVVSLCRMGQLLSTWQVKKVIMT